jgi:hypothetical protein
MRSNGTATRTSTEVRSPTRTSTEVRSPTRTSTWANTRGNFTSTVTGGAGAGATSVTINIPGNYKKVPFVGGAPAGIMHKLDGLTMEKVMSKITRMPPVMVGPKGVPGLMRWVRRVHPNIYDNVRARLAVSNLRGLGFALPTADPVPAAAANPSTAQTILSTVQDLIKVGLPMYQQNQLFNLQIKRAQAGLAPLDATTMNDLSSVKVGVDSATRNTALYIGGGLALALVAYKLLSR